MGGFGGRHLDARRSRKETGDRPADYIDGVRPTLEQWDRPQLSGP
jgi:hypothetical protein